MCSPTDVEAVLARLPRRGVPMILREVREGITKPYSFSGIQRIVHTMRDKISLPFTFTLDACRHGGMTELEEAELTDGQGRALSAHKRHTKATRSGRWAARSPQLASAMLTGLRARRERTFSMSRGTTLARKARSALSNWT